MRATPWTSLTCAAAASLALGVAVSLAPRHVHAQTGDVFSSNGGRSAGGGDVFSSGSSPYGGGNTTRRTGKQATQDDSVYCQQTPDGRVIPKPYGGTRRNIPCGPNFVQRRPEPVRREPTRDDDPRCTCPAKAPGRDAAPTQRMSSSRAAGGAQDVPLAQRRGASASNDACVCDDPDVRYVFNYLYVNGINTPRTGQGRGNYQWDLRLIESNLLDLAPPLGATSVRQRPRQPASIKVRSETDRFLDENTYNPSGTQGNEWCAQYRRNPGRYDGGIAANRAVLDTLCTISAGGDFFRGGAGGGMAWGDLLECAYQNLGSWGLPGFEPEPVPRAVQLIVDTYRRERQQTASGPRTMNFFIVIGHSQGNFFVESIAKSLSNQREFPEIYRERLGVLSLASPSNYVSLDAGFRNAKLKFRTRTDDAIIGLLYPPLNARRPFQPNLSPLWEWPEGPLYQWRRLFDMQKVDLPVFGRQDLLPKIPLAEAMGWKVPDGCRPAGTPECDGALYTAFMNSHLIDNYLMDPPLTQPGRPVPIEVQRFFRQPRSPATPNAVLNVIRSDLRALKQTLLDGASRTSTPQSAAYRPARSR